jgi:hypothetical protein
MAKILEPILALARYTKSGVDFYYNLPLIELPSWTEALTAIIKRENKKR